MTESEFEADRLARVLTWLDDRATDYKARAAACRQ